MEYTGAQLAYLDHLGIDVWVTRESLLNADQQNSIVATEQAMQYAAPVQTMSNQAVPNQTVPVQPAQAPVQMPAHQMTAAPIQQVQPTAQPIAQSTTQAAVALAPTKTGSPLSAAPAFPATEPVLSNIGTMQPAPIFNIQFWCYSTGIWMVSGNVNLEPEHHKLVHNIAQFIQGKKRKPKHVGIFSWPMLDSPNIDQGPEVASKHLKDHIHRLQEVSTVKKVVVFADCDDWFEHLNPVKLNVTLSDVLNSPEAKKSLWQQLIPHQVED
jgi:hypothetical protein